MTESRTYVVHDPISPEDAAAPEEHRKKDAFGEELAHAIAIAAIATCDAHGVGAKAWHVGVEMRSPISVRERFFVTIDADAKRICDIGPMSADVVDHLLSFVESGLRAKLPGSETGSLSREITDLSTRSEHSAGT